MASKQTLHRGQELPRAVGGGIWKQLFLASFFFRRVRCLFRVVKFGLNTTQLPFFLTSKPTEKCVPSHNQHLNRALFLNQLTKDVACALVACCTIQAQKDTQGSVMEPHPAVNALIAGGKAAVTAGDRTTASQQLHEATKVSVAPKADVNQLLFRHGEAGEMETARPPQETWFDLVEDRGLFRDSL